MLQLRPDAAKIIKKKISRKGSFGSDRRGESRPRTALWKTGREHGSEVKIQALLISIPVIVHRTLDLSEPHFPSL